jgi:hypothetical protein
MKTLTILLLSIILFKRWGYLTGVGGCNLDADTAAKIQDDLAEYILQQLKMK